MARFVWNLEEFQRIRKCEGMQAHLGNIGNVAKARCNADLHAAQAARKQPQADGYEATVTVTGDRARLFITPITARAMAHEAVNHAILKNLPIGNVPDAAADRSVPRELAERSNESQQRNAAFMSHVRAFT